MLTVIFKRIQSIRSRRNGQRCCGCCLSDGIDHTNHIYNVVRVRVIPVNQPRPTDSKCLTVNNVTARVVVFVCLNGIVQRLCWGNRWKIPAIIGNQ